MQFLHLSYLQQLGEILEDAHKSQAARLGYIAKQICEKHVVHLSGSDVPKLRHCRACQGPITSECLHSKKGNKIVIKCNLCGQTRTYDKAKQSKPQVAR